MPSISLSVSGQTSDAYEVGPGTRVTATGSGYVEWSSNSLADERNGVATWSTWPKGATTGYADTLRRVLIRGVATGALSVTWDEGERDEGPDDAYWQEQVPAWSLDSSGNVQGLVLPDGRISIAQATASVDSMSYSAGRLVSYQASGVGFTLAYNPDNTLDTVTSQGKTLAFSYNPDGTLSSAIWS